MVSKEMNIHDVLEANPGIEKVFFDFGMHCLGCPISRGESVEQAAQGHGINVDELMSALNAYKCD